MSEDSKKSKSSDTTTSTSQSSPSSKPAADSPRTDIAPSTPTTKASPSPPPSSSKPAATTAVAKKEPEPPPFEKGLMTQLSTRFGDKVKASYIRPLRIKIYVDPANIVEVASFLRDSMGFDHAESVAGIDY